MEQKGTLLREKTPKETTNNKQSEYRSVCKGNKLKLCVCKVGLSDIPFLSSFCLAENNCHLEALGAFLLYDIVAIKCNGTINIIVPFNFDPSLVCYKMIKVGWGIGEEKYKFCHIDRENEYLVRERGEGCFCEILEAKLNNNISD